MSPRKYQGETKAERRNYPRLPLKLWLYYQCLQRGDMTASFESLSEDLGAGGMAMRCERNLSPDQMLLITLFLPVDDRPPSSQFTPEAPSATILARVAWCRTQGPHDYLAGVEFLNVTHENRRRLKAFLSEYRLDDPKSPLYS